MGLLKSLFQSKKAKQTGGNFGIIAQNIAAMYTAIGLTPFGESLDEEHKLFAIGLINIASYLKNGMLTEKSVKDSILYGSIGQVGLDFYNITHRQMFDYEDNYVLVGFTMQLEVFIFDATVKGVNYRDIVNQVCAHKEIIADTINATLSQGTKCSNFEAIMPNVLVWSSQPEFQQTVNDYKRK